MCSEGGLLSKMKVQERFILGLLPTLEDGGDLKLTASQLDHTCTKIETDPNSYLCVIPQRKERVAFYLQITYTVQQGTSQQYGKGKEKSVRC